ncbi:MAG: hypothetical protein IV100_06345 [Myxococcales bacterium]|nr:hypothetical protein [Myxococcales bacterium]
MAAIRLGRALTLFVVIALSAGSAFFPRAAWADAPEKEANARYEEAKALMNDGEFAAAVEKLTEALALFKHPLIMKKRAEAWEKLVDFERALVDYREYLSLLPASKKQDRRVASDRIAQLEALLQKPVAVKVVSTPPGVLVTRVGSTGAPERTPFEAQLVPGRYTFKIADPRFASGEATVRVLAGATQAVQLAATARTGRVVVRTSRPTLEGISVAIDAEPVDVTPGEVSSGVTTPRALAVGRHNVVCAIPGSPNAYVEFEVSEGQTTEVSCQVFDSASSGSSASAWGWTMVGIGTAGVLAGTGLLVSYALDVQTAEERNQDLVTNKHWIGGTALGVGLVVGIASYWVFTSDDDAAGAERQPGLPLATWVPTVEWSEDGAVVGLGATF